MRVIAGTAKGRRLTAPPGERTRPTADRVKEALFSSLQPDLLDASVLDLYAGSGALGIEALSRGASHVTFVERSRRAARSLRQNLEVTDLVGRAEVIERPVLAVLESAPVGAPFDVVFLDPPYGIATDELAEVLRALVPHLAAGCRISVEGSVHGTPPRWPSSVRAERERRYGDTVLYGGRAATTEGA